MIRRVFPVLSAISLVICIAAIAAGVAGHVMTFGWTSHHRFWSRGVFGWSPTTHNHDLIVSHGILYDMGEESFDTRLAGRPAMDEHRVLSPADLQGLNRDQTFHGFSWHETRRTWGASDRYVERYWQRSAPLWFFAVLSGILPTLWLITLQRTRWRAARLRSGRCPTCGYDLRASTGRCPECGTPIPIKMHA